MDDCVISDFGVTRDGQPVRRYTLANDAGMRVVLTDFGATVVALETPDSSGAVRDIVLGYDSLADYEAGKAYFGATIGRFANRVNGGRFTLDGREYALAANSEGHHLHGGTKGFDKVVWSAEPFGAPDGVGVRFRYLSEDGEEGYPGNLDCAVAVTLTGDNSLAIAYEAKTDKPTIVNLTNHSYFNLAGHDAGDILGHMMIINADAYTVVDDEYIPTGELAPVDGTPLDFRRERVVGDRIGVLTAGPGGYDHNMVLSGGTGLKLAASVREPVSGRRMRVQTTEPGMQFYSGNFLDGTERGKGGCLYAKHAGFCLEAQHFPDSPNHPAFPSVVLRPGETYTQTTIYAFSAE